MAREERVMPIVTKPPTSGASSGSIDLPQESSGLVDPTELSNETLTDLGYDPNNLPQDISYPNGTAMSLVPNGNGDIVLSPTDISNSQSANNFLGFMSAETDSTSPNPNVLSVRGAEITIFGEDSLTFSVGETVYLSTVVGRVTNVPPTSASVALIRVGFCISATKFVLNTDQRINL